MEVEPEGDSIAPLKDAAANGSITEAPTSSPVFYPDDADSACSSPYVSAPSSPCRGPSLPIPNYCYYFSAPTSPVHYVLASLPYTGNDDSAADGGGPILTAGGEVSSPSGSSEFEFSARFSDSCGGGTGARDSAEMMCPADELFLNGQIRPMRLACHLERPQALAPLPDLEGEPEEEVDQEEGLEKETKQSALEEEFTVAAAASVAARGREYFFSHSKLRSRSLHRRARSMSPLRTAREPPFQWRDAGEEQVEEKAVARSASRRRRVGIGEGSAGAEAVDPDEQGRGVAEEEELEEAATPSVSASSSRCSSSSGRNSKRWIFLKDLLYRSKSEGRGNEREREIRERDRFWHNLSFSPAKDKAASLFVFSRAAKLKEPKPKPEAAPEGPAAVAEDPEGAASTNSDQPPVVPSAEPTKQEGEDEKKKKQMQKQKQKPKQKQKQKKNDEEPINNTPPAPALAGDNSRGKPAKPAAGVSGKQRTTSAHERHYAAKRAQAEELRKRTFLPYRQGLLGCLGFSSRGYNYTAVSGLARTLNTVSSR